MNTRHDLSGRAFGDVDGTGYTESFVAYLDSATQQFQSLKQRSWERLDLGSGDRVLDVGCGLGDDVRELVRLVGLTGHVIGVDSSQTLLAQCRRRSADVPFPVGFVAADAHDLPFASNLFTACRADRVLQHLRNPRQALREMVRVVRPGGRVSVVDRDWGLVALDADDRETTRFVVKRMAEGIRNAWVGPSLHALFLEVGIEPVIEPVSIPLFDLNVADTLLDLVIVANNAVTEGRLDKAAVTSWLTELKERDRTGRFSAVLTLVIASGVRSL
jgi:ubiquinone/menaquinone biosynthesis C-methylase UbiE